MGVGWGRGAEGALLESGVNIEGFITGSDPPCCGSWLSKCEVPREVVRKGVGRLEPLELKLGTHPQWLSERRAQRKGEIADTAAVLSL